MKWRKLPKSCVYQEKLIEKMIKMLHNESIKTLFEFFFYNLSVIFWGGGGLVKKYEIDIG